VRLAKTWSRERENEHTAAKAKAKAKAGAVCRFRRKRGAQRRRELTVARGSPARDPVRDGQGAESSI
jgi:hypothetical protein